MEGGVGRGGDLGAESGDRDAREGDGSDGARSGGGLRRAVEGVAQVLGRAHGHAVSPGRHPGARTAQGRPTGQRPDAFELRLPQLPALWLWRPVAWRPELGTAAPELPGCAASADVARTAA